MTAQSAFMMALLGSLWLVVYSIGARSQPGDAFYLFRHPALLLRAVLAIFVIAPIIAVLISTAFDLEPAIRFALIALSVAPVPAMLSQKQAKVGTKGNYAIGLLTAIAVISVIATPLLVFVISRVMGVDATVAAADVATKLVLTIAIPLAAGLALRKFAPTVAAATHRAAFILGAVILVGGVVVILASSWQQIVDLLGNGSVLAIVAMVVAGLAVGHLLGSTPEDERGGLALATVTRHPGVAIAIAAASFPERQKEAIAGVLLFVLVSAVVTGLYSKWMKGRAASG